MYTYKLFASDHRTPGATGDEWTAETHTIEGAHAMAAELKCGFYGIQVIGNPWVAYFECGTDGVPVAL